MLASVGGAPTESALSLIALSMRLHTIVWYLRQPTNGASVHGPKGRFGHVLSTYGDEGCRAVCAPLFRRSVRSREVQCEGGISRMAMPATRRLHNGERRASRSSLWGLVWV